MKGLNPLVTIFQLQKILYYHLAKCHFQNCLSALLLILILHLEKMGATHLPSFQTMHQRKIPPAKCKLHCKSMPDAVTKTHWTTDNPIRSCDDTLKSSIFKTSGWESLEEDIEVLLDLPLLLLSFIWEPKNNSYARILKHQTDSRHWSQW